MNDLDEITLLKKAQDAARAEQTRREAQADQADGVYQEAMTKLKELGFDSPDDALAEAARIREGLSGSITEITERLKEAGKQ
jgi:hypothetical protein